MGKSQGNIPETVKHPRPGTKGNHSLPGVERQEEDPVLEKTGAQG